MFKKVFASILVVFAVVGIISAVEPYAAQAGRADVADSLSSGATGELTGDVTIPSGSTFTIDSGAVVVSTWAVTLDVTGAEGINVTYGITAGTAVISGEITALSAGITDITVVNGTADDVNVAYGIVAATATFNTGLTATAISAGSIVTTGQEIGLTDAMGNTVYSLIVSTVLANTEELSLTAADGKAGGFDIIMGTHTARGSFTAAGVVTLTSDGSGDATTTNDNTETLNVYDGGTVVVVENGASPTYTAYIRYWYVN